MFFICLHNQLSSFNSIIVHMSEKREKLKKMSEKRDSSNTVKINGFFSQ